MSSWIFKAIALTSVLFAGSAFSCQPNGWDPVDPVFCDDDPFPLTPPPSAYVEYQARTGYAVYVLADGTRVTLDLGRGSITMLFPNGTLQVALVSQLDAAAQQQFWAVARHAAQNPSAEFKLPIDQIQAMGSATPSSISPGPKEVSSGGTSNCRPGASAEPPPNTLPCVQVTSPSFFYSSFTGSWARFGIGDFVAGGTFMCPYGDNRSACDNFLRMDRERWEQERQQACFDRNVAIAGVVLGAGVAIPGCSGTAVALGLTSTGVGAPVGAPAAVVAGIGCAAGAGLVVLSAIQVQDKDKACTASYRGPGR